MNLPATTKEHTLSKSVRAFLQKYDEDEAEAALMLLTEHKITLKTLKNYDVKPSTLRTILQYCEESPFFIAPNQPPKARKDSRDRVSHKLLQKFISFFCNELEVGSTDSDEDYFHYQISKLEDTSYDVSTAMYYTVWFAEKYDLYDLDLVIQYLEKFGL